jgi:hypothetical protein
MTFTNYLEENEAYNLDFEKLKAYESIKFSNILKMREIGRVIK